MNQANGFAPEPGGPPGERATPDPEEDVPAGEDALAEADASASADAPTPWDATGSDEADEFAAEEGAFAEIHSDDESPAGAVAGYSQLLDQTNYDAVAAAEEDLDDPEVAEVGDAVGDGGSPTLTLVSESWLTRTAAAAEALSDTAESDALLEQAAASAAGTGGQGLRELLRLQRPATPHDRIADVESASAASGDAGDARPSEDSPAPAANLDEQEEAALAAAQAVVRRGTRRWPTLMMPVRWWRRPGRKRGGPVKVVPLGGPGDGLQPPGPPETRAVAGDEQPGDDDGPPELAYESAVEPERVARSGRTGGVLTIPLLCAGIGLVACCLLIPQADMNRRLAYERERLRRDLESIQLQVATNEEFLRKVADDPALAERLAQRQMKTVRAGTRVLPLRPGEAVLEDGDAGVRAAADMSPFQLVTVQPPPPLPPYAPKSGMMASLCHNARSRLFLTGAGLLLMAVGLVLGYGPPAAPETPRPRH